MPASVSEQKLDGHRGAKKHAQNKLASMERRPLYNWRSTLWTQDCVATCAADCAEKFPGERSILCNDMDDESLTCFVDASWSLNSTSGGVLTWNNCCLKTFSRKQSTIALSSAEAELAASESQSPLQGKSRHTSTSRNSLPLMPGAAERFGDLRGFDTSWLSLASSLRFFATFVLKAAKL